MALDTSVPSTRALQKLIAESHNLEVKLVTGDILRGKILWQDTECLCLGLEGGERFILWRTNLAYLKVL